MSNDYPRRDKFTDFTIAGVGVLGCIGIVGVFTRLGAINDNIGDIKGAVAVVNVKIDEHGRRLEDLEDRKVGVPQR